jgi:hypothetical protein
MLTAHGFQPQQHSLVCLRTTSHVGVGSIRPPFRRISPCVRPKSWDPIIGRDRATAAAVVAAVEHDVAASAPLLPFKDMKHVTVCSASEQGGAFDVQGLDLAPLPGNECSTEPAGSANRDQLRPADATATHQEKVVGPKEPRYQEKVQGCVSSRMFQLRQKVPDLWGGRLSRHLHRLRLRVLSQLI